MIVRNCYLTIWKCSTATDIYCEYFWTDGLCIQVGKHLFALNFGFWFIYRNWSFISLEYENFLVIIAMAAMVIKVSASLDSFRKESYIKEIHKTSTSASINKRRDVRLNVDKYSKLKNLWERNTSSTYEIWHSSIYSDLLEQKANETFVPNRISNDFIIIWHLVAISRPSKILFGSVFINLSYFINCFRFGVDLNVFTSIEDSVLGQIDV